MPNKATLVFLLKNNLTSLGLKKRGFGKDLWNGYGGKPNEGETIEDAAIRETFEECGTKILKMKKMGELDFSFTDKPEWNQTVYVFVSNSGEWENEPVESEEMKPDWFDASDLPYTHMWPDDSFWLPLVLKGEFVKAEFLLTSNQKLVSAKINGKVKHVN